MTLREAVIELLRSDGPKHYQALTDEILAKGLAFVIVEDAGGVSQRDDRRGHQAQRHQERVRSRPTSTRTMETGC